MLAVDFFHVGCAVTLRQLYVLFVLNLGRVKEPRASVFASSPHTDGRWSQPLGAIGSPRDTAR
jgi:hypothetical protein